MTRNDGMTKRVPPVRDIKNWTFSLWWVLDEMQGTQREPQQKKGRGAREVELGTPSFDDASCIA